MQIGVGSPLVLVTKFLCGQVILFCIARAAVKCIAETLSMASRKFDALKM